MIFAFIVAHPRGFYKVFKNIISRGKTFIRKKNKGLCRFFYGERLVFCKRFGGTNPALESAAGNITRTVIAKFPALR
jgi:hypothetical protein